MAATLAFRGGPRRSPGVRVANIFARRPAALRAVPVPSINAATNAARALFFRESAAPVLDRTAIGIAERGAGPGVRPERLFRRESSGALSWSSMPNTEKPDRRQLSRRHTARWRRPIAPPCASGNEERVCPPRRNTTQAHWANSVEVQVRKTGNPATGRPAKRHNVIECGSGPTAVVLAGLVIRPDERGVCIHRQGIPGLTRGRDMLHVGRVAPGHEQIVGHRTITEQPPAQVPGLTSRRPAPPRSHENCGIKPSNRCC